MNMLPQSLRIFGFVFLIGAFITLGHISGYGENIFSTKTPPQFHEKISTIQNTASMDTLIVNKESEVNSFTSSILEISSIGPGTPETSFIGRGNPRLIYCADFKWVSPYQDRLSIKLRGL